MQVIRVSYEAARNFDAPAHDVVAFFHDVAALARLTPHLVMFDCIDAATVDFTLETQRDLGLEFTPRYRLHYAWETPRTLTWCAVPVEGGNVEIAARLRFIELSGRTCEVRVEEAIAFTLPITFITAKIVQVIAKRESIRDMQTLLARVQAVLTVRPEPEPEPEPIT